MNTLFEQMLLEFSETRDEVSSMIINWDLYLCIDMQVVYPF